MRISTAYLAQRGLNSLLQQQGRLSDIQEQIATGKRIIRPSDDPSGVAQILRLNEAISVTDQYQRNADNAANRLTLEESTLDNVQETLLRIRELAVQGSNSTLSPEDRESLAVEVRQRLAGLVSLANTRDANQNFLFSGYKVTTKPFSQAADGSYVYSGDQGQRSLQIASGRNIADADSGNDVFVNIKNGNSTFQVNMNAGNTVIPGSFTTAASDGTAAIATENTVTAIAGTDGGGGGEQFILTIDGAPAVDVTFGAGDTVATPAVAAELDTDLATFITGSGGAYSIVSGSLSGGDLVLSKADGTTITFDTSTSTLSGVAASVTESETTTGTPAVAPTDTAFTMSIDGTQFFTEAAAIGGTVTAAELDSALTTFIAGSGGTYTATGSIAAGTLVVTKTDGSSVNLTIDSNFSGTVGAFTGSLTSGLNSGDGVFNIGSVVDATAYIPETYTLTYVTNAGGNLAYNVVGSTSGQLIPAPPLDIVNDAPDHLDGASIQFNGIQTGISGTPAIGDSFTITPSTKQDMFSTVQKLAVALEGGITGQTGLSATFNAMNQALSEIDIAFENVSSVRAGIGARLRAIEDQGVVNSSFKLEMEATLSSVRDLDIVSAVVQLQSRTASLEAAQASYSRIQGLTLFNFL
jgi:flagellin-like hook-associated protein FlgL